MNKPTLRMLVGIPGSGKSTLAEAWSNSEENMVVHSSDKLREEMFGDVNAQGNNAELFAELHRRIKEDLKAGRNVVYDATNIRRDRREKFLQEIEDIDCYTTCSYLKCTLLTALMRNRKRSRVVPEEVIARMFLNLDIPDVEEGWGLVITFTITTEEDEA